MTWLKMHVRAAAVIVPPYWHRHDELVWELSALHCHWLSCYHESAQPVGADRWMREFADARHRLRDWVSICGTRLDRDRPTRQTTWPGENGTDAGGEIEIPDRRQDFAEFVRDDVLRRSRVEGDRAASRSSVEPSIAAGSGRAAHSSTGTRRPAHLTTMSATLESPDR